MLKAPGPLLVSNTLCELLLVPAPWLEKVRLARLKLATGAVMQPDKLKLTILVRQLNVPSAGMYSLVYQKVQSSSGSTVIAL